MFKNPTAYALALAAMTFTALEQNRALAMPVPMPVQYDAAIASAAVTPAAAQAATPAARAPGAALAPAASTPAAPARPLDAAARRAVVERIAQTVADQYLYADMGAKVAADLRARSGRGEYDALPSDRAFAEALTEHMRATSHDGHMYVRAAPPPSASPRPAGPPPGMRRSENFGIRKVEILDGNVGLLRIDGFADPEEAGPAFAAAMAFLANTDALVLDLRGNGGGDAGMVALAVSYFVPEKPVQLMTFTRPRTNEREESWTRAKVDGPRYLGKPVYVLTSKRTFSAGEEFAYDMQSLKRASLIGEATGGGGHNNLFFPVGDGFSVSVSVSEAVNAITGKGWEGTGVQPDVRVAPETALATATDAARQALRAETTPAGGPAPATRPVASGVVAATSAATPATVSAATPAPSTADAVSVDLPKTPAGVALAEFLAAFNAKDEAALRRFHAKYPSKRAGGEDRFTPQDLAFREQSGGLSVERVAESTDYAITVVAETRADGSRVHFTMRFAAEAPHGLESVEIRGGD